MDLVTDIAKNWWCRAHCSTLLKIRKVWGRAFQPESQTLETSIFETGHPAVWRQYKTAIYQSIIHYIYMCVCLLCIYLDTYTYMYIKAKAYISCPMICSWTNLHFLYHPSRARCQQVTVIFASNPCPMPHKRNPWEFPTQISRGEGRRGAKMGPFFPIFELFESETICQIANADIAWLIKEQGTWTPFNLESSLITV